MEGTLSLSPGKPHPHTHTHGCTNCKNRSQSNHSRATTHSDSVSIMTSQVNNDLCVCLYEHACNLFSLINSSAALCVTLTQLCAKMNNNLQTMWSTFCDKVLCETLFQFPSLFFFYCPFSHFIYLLCFLVRQHTQFFVQMKKEARESNSVLFSFSLRQPFPTSLFLSSKLFLLHIYYMSASPFLHVHALSSLSRRAV